LAESQCLREVAKELEFILFLARLEKQVTKDDEQDYHRGYRGGGIEREVSLTHVVRVDRTPLSENSINVTEEDMLEENVGDGDADESEHEGYSANSGATATYWYRNAVSSYAHTSKRTNCLLTTFAGAGYGPECNGIRFRFNCGSDPCSLLAWLKSLRAVVPSTNEAGKELTKLCSMIHVLKFTGSDDSLLPARTYGSGCRRPPETELLVSEIVLSALKCDAKGFLSNFDITVKDVPFSDEEFREFGRELCSRTYRPPAKLR
jgi:hypothetical protein